MARNTENTIGRIAENIATAEWSQYFRGSNTIYADLNEHPLKRTLNLPDFKYCFDKEPKDIRLGDLFIHFDENWKLALAMGEYIGRRKLYFSGEKNNPVNIADNSTMEYRIRRDIKFQQPTLLSIKQETYKAKPEKVLNDAEIGKPLADLQCSVNDRSTIYEAKDRKYRLVQINSPEEVMFSNKIDKNSTLENDYFLLSSEGMPIIISDYHQKLAVHLAQLIVTNNLPNEKPIVDWIDYHDDTSTEFGINPSFSPVPVKTYDEICHLVSGIPSTFAALLPYVFGLADFRYFKEMMGCETAYFVIPQWSIGTINPFSYSNPFARNILNQPHVLSFDLDQLKSFCNTKDGKLEPITTNSYFDWLKKSGINRDNYDAVLIYTSPGYCNRNIAEEGIQRLVSLF